MGIIEIYSQQSFFWTTIIGLALLFFSSLYATYDREKIYGSIWFLFLALVLDFCAGRASYSAISAYTQGASISKYIFIEVSFLLLSMLCFINASIKFLRVDSVLLYIVGGIGALGFIAIALVIFLVPDGEFVNNMRQVFPLVGFLSISLGLWAQLNKKHNSGYVLAAAVCSLIAVWLLFRMFVSSVGGVETWWFIPLSVYILLSFAVIMMRLDNLRDQNDKNISEIEKYNNKIEDIIKLSPFPIIISRLGDDKIILANNNAVKMFGINPRELDRYKFKDFFADSDNRKILNERLESEHGVQDFEVLIKTPYSEVPFWLLTSANVLDCLILCVSRYYISQE